MNAEQQAESRRICEAATPGEWEARERTDQGGTDYPVIEHYVWAYPYGRPAGPQGVCEGMLRGVDCQFIVHAHTALPAALDALDAAEKREAELEARYNELKAAAWACPLDELPDAPGHAETVREIEDDVMRAADLRAVNRQQNKAAEAAKEEPSG